MLTFVRKPSIDLFPGVLVKKDLELTYENESVTQTLKDLVLHTVQKVSGEGYDGTYDITLKLSEGDILIFEPDGRGYIKPSNYQFVSVEDAIADLEAVKGVGCENVRSE